MLLAQFLPLEVEPLISLRGGVLAQRVDTLLSPFGFQSQHVQSQLLTGCRDRPTNVTKVNLDFDIVPAKSRSQYQVAQLGNARDR